MKLLIVTVLVLTLLSCASTTWKCYDARDNCKKVVCEEIQCKEGDRILKIYPLYTGYVYNSNDLNSADTCIKMKK